MKKADEWCRLLTVSPVILWSCWKDQDDSIPDSEPPSAPNEKITATHSRNCKSLYDAILLLCCAVRVLSNQRVTMGQVKAGHKYFVQYCHCLLMLKCLLTINHYLSMHLASMVKRFGPVYGWWLFPFEWYNGMLKCVNTNGHNNGKMELTMLRSWVQGHLFYNLLSITPSGQMFDSNVKCPTAKESFSAVWVWHIKSLIFAKMGFVMGASQTLKHKLIALHLSSETANESQFASMKSLLSIYQKHRSHHMYVQLCGSLF